MWEYKARSGEHLVTHAESDILECEVKWALGSIATNKASGGDGILAELFQILQDDAVQVLHSTCRPIWVATGQEKVQPPPNSQEGWFSIALISHASRIMLKILHARLYSYVNQELPDVQAAFRKGRGIAKQTANIHWIVEKAREFRKNIYFCFLLHWLY